MAEAAPYRFFGKSRREYRALFERADQDRIREDLRVFFGPRAEKYVGVYEQMRANNKGHVVTWNWAVFLTVFPWYFYRKMYVMGSLLIFVPVLAGYLFGPTGNVGSMAGFAVSAKSQYVLSGIKRLQKADALNLVGEERQEYVRRAGGVSVVAGILAALLFAAVSALAILGIYLERYGSAG